MILWRRLLIIFGHCREITHFMFELVSEENAPDLGLVMFTIFL
jgi:hypothetical protein